MNKPQTSILLMLISAVFLAGCAVDSVIIKPGYDFKRIKRVAVLEFKDPLLYRQSGSMVSELFVKYLLKIGYSIVERDEINAIIREHDLFVSGILNREHLKEFGKISGVDAIIIGSITMLVPAQTFYEGEKIRFIAAQVGITCRMIDVETGEILWVGSNTYDGMNVQTAFEYLISSIVDKFIKDVSKNNKVQN